MLSASAVHKRKHIIDPRLGKPAQSKIAAWSYCQSAAIGDGLSTAFVIMSEDEIAGHVERYDHRRAVTVGVDGGVKKYGEWQR